MDFLDVYKRLPLFSIYVFLNQGFPGGSDGKESACTAGDPGQLFNGHLYSRISWTEEPDELQSMGLQRVDHD